MTDDDKIIMAKTIYGEARGEGKEGMEAVACVILNRYKSGKWFTGYIIKDGIKVPSISQTCLKSKQFSCWNKKDRNYKILQKLDLDNKIYSFCMHLANKAISSDLEDFTNNATYYHTKNIRPKWSEHKSPCYEVGNHLFYNDID